MNITPHFTSHDSLYLPSWNVEHIPTEVEKSNLLITFQKLELIRDFLGGKPVNVHCALRPILNNPTSSYHSQDYNQFVGGSKNSAHKIGKAIDFHVVGISCDEVRAKLLPKLEEFNIRIENNPGSTWVHFDTFPPNPNRFFKP